MKTRAVVCAGLHEPWNLEEIEIDPPGIREVQVEMAYAGMCHSDEHLRTGDLGASPEALEAFGIQSLFPIVGGHEGAGVVSRVGPEATETAVGDHVAVSFVPACGVCFWCASGRQHLCDSGSTALCGPMISDGTWRYHFGGKNLNRMAQLGTFSETMVCHENSLVKIEPHLCLKAAALISCGIATGFGSAVDRAKVSPGEVVVVVGCGGVGSGAILGSSIMGAQTIVGVDPLIFKQQKALEIGATHTALSLEEAIPLVTELTYGRMADVVILTPGVLYPELIQPSSTVVGKDGRIVVTAVPTARTFELDLFHFQSSNQTLMGSIFGSKSPRVQIPRLLALYDKGLLKVDELITQEYGLGTVQAGYDDLAAGRNIRGLVSIG